MNYLKNLKCEKLEKNNKKYLNNLLYWNENSILKFF